MYTCVAKFIQKTMSQVFFISSPSPQDDTGNSNIFSNDGSFMSQYKALLEKQKQDNQDKEEKEKEKQKSDEKQKIKEEKQHNDNYDDSPGPKDEQKKYSDKGSR